MELTEHFNTLGVQFEKAFDPSHGGTLKPVLITDKNGHHRIVWKSPADIAKLNKEGHKHVVPIERGHKLTVDNKVYQLEGVKQDGYINVTDAEGKKYARSLKKTDFHHPHEPNVKVPLEGESKVKDATEEVEFKTTPVSGTKEVDNEEPLDYEKYGSPAERLRDWDTMIEEFATGKAVNLTASYGTGGVGKTYAVINNAKIKAGLEAGTVVKFTGGTTPGGFFEMLYNNQDKNIILDDFDMVLEDKDMLSLLTNISRSTGDVVLNNPRSGNVHEEESEGKVPPRFHFTGKVMLISNVNLDKEAEKNGDKSDKYEKLLTNAATVNLRLTTKETWDLMNDKILHDGRKLINGKPNPDYGKINKGLKFQDALGSPLQVSDTAKEDIAEYFKKNWQNMEELSGRTLTKANAIRQYYTAKGANWEQYADSMLLKDKPKLSVNQRFDIFNDSLDMIKQGLLKSAVIVDDDPNTIVEFFKSEGLQRSEGKNNVCKLVDQMNPEYLPGEGERVVTDSFAVISGADITERKLYEELWKHNGKVIVFDKTAKNILSSKLGQGLLKGALDTSGDGELSWLSSVNTGRKKPDYKPNDFENGAGFAEQLKLDGYNFEMTEAGNVDIGSLTHPHDVPNKFPFKGRCIFLTDNLDQAPQPIRSRSMLADVTTDPEEFLERSNFLATHRERKNIKFSSREDLGHQDYRKAVDFLNTHKDKVNKKHLSEAGIIKVAGWLKDKPTGETVEDRQKYILRQINKGLKTEIGGIELDLTKAFQDLAL